MCATPACSRSHSPSVEWRVGAALTAAAVTTAAGNLCAALSAKLRPPASPAPASVQDLQKAFETEAGAKKARCGAPPTAAGGYRPTIRVDAEPGFLQLADAYDQAQIKRGDERRAYRG